MGLRSAFNPLGVLPYTTVEWDVGGLTSGVYPTSWKLWNGASTFSTVSSSNVDAVENTVNGSLVVTFSCGIPSGWYVVTNVTLNDDNFSVSS